MAQNINRSTKSRIEADLVVWDAIEASMVKRHGDKIFKDPGFLAAKRDMFRDLLEKYGNRTRNIREKAELRVARSMARKNQRAMLRRMFPNPFIRLVRNMLALAVNIFLLATRMAGATLRAPFVVLFNQLRRPAYQQVPTGQRQDRNSQNNRQAGTSKTTQQAARQQNKKKPADTKQNKQRPANTHQKNGKTQSSTIVRKMPTRSRVTMPVVGKGLKR